MNNYKIEINKAEAQPAQRVDWRQRLIDMALEFPCLRRAAHKDGAPILPQQPLHPYADLSAILQDLANWSTRAGSSAGVQATAFVLEVYNGNGGFDHPDFDLVRAIGTWDSAHRRAFAKWAAEPFLC